MLLETVRTNYESYGAHDAIDALADIGDPRLAPLLLEMLQRRIDAEDAMHGQLTDSDTGAIRALGKLQAKEAVPLLLELFDLNKRDCYPGARDELTVRGVLVLSALVDLDAQGVAPLLLEHTESIAVIEWLAQLKERRAIPALRAIVANKGQVVRNGVALRPHEDAKRLFTARVALIGFEEDPVPGFCELLADRSLDEWDRERVVWMLAYLRDPRSVPHLLTAIRADPSGWVVNQAIKVMPEFESPLIVPGLIECFDAEFDDKAFWKRAYTPEMFRQSIAETLRTITGQSFGPDKQQWEDWWRRNSHSSK